MAYSAYSIHIKTAIERAGWVLIPLLHLVENETVIIHLNFDLLSAVSVELVKCVRFEVEFGVDIGLVYVSVRESRGARVSGVVDSYDDVSVADQVLDEIHVIGSAAAPCGIEKQDRKCVGGLREWSVPA